MEVRDAHVLLGRQKPQMFPFLGWPSAAMMSACRAAAFGADGCLRGPAVDLLTVLAVNISAHNKTVRDAQRTLFL